MASLGELSVALCGRLIFILLLIFYRFESILFIISGKKIFP